MPKSPEVVSCGVLLLAGDPVDSFLLMKHPDRWDLPKGHVDPGETEIECALREMEEETGIDRSEVELDPDFRFVHEYYVQYKRTKNKRKLKHLIIFLGHIDEPRDIDLTEHSDYQWVKWNPPHKIQNWTIDPLLEEVHAYLEK